MASATARITAEAHAKLKALADKSGEPMPAVLDEAIEAYRRQEFLIGLAKDFERLRQDADAWADELAERQFWETTLSDGLDED